MKQTPIHDRYNPDLLRLIPTTRKNIVDVGCGGGALARALKARDPLTSVIGIEIDPEYSQIASRFCDLCLTLDIEAAGDHFWATYANRDCWIFGDLLEHLKDPWTLLRTVYEVVRPGTYVVACIPNAQHWTVQTKLCAGEFWYQEVGLLDKTHLRWFTRKTIINLFGQSGFVIEAMIARVFDEPKRENHLSLIGLFAENLGLSAKEAMRDATPLQYLVLAKKVGSS